MVLRVVYKRAEPSWVLQQRGDRVSCFDCLEAEILEYPLDAKREVAKQTERSRATEGSNEFVGDVGVAWMVVDKLNRKRVEIREYSIGHRTSPPRRRGTLRRPTVRLE